MARTQAANKYRAAHTRRVVTIELRTADADRWTEYAHGHGGTMAGMIRACVERCIAEDSGGTWAEDEETETETETATEDRPETATGGGSVL